MSNDAERLATFIDSSPSPYHAVLSSSQFLEAEGFSAVDQLGSGEPPAKGYVSQSGVLIAWDMSSFGSGGQPENAAPEFRIIGAHTDSPNLRLKPHQLANTTFAQLSAEPYGGVLRNSWLNRDLGMSGRVFARRAGAAGKIEEHLCMSDSAVAVLPQLAIHLDREANTSLSLNPQTQMNPLWGLPDDEPDGLNRWILHQIEKSGVDTAGLEILSHDLMLHDISPSSIVGPAGDLFAAPRLDNLCSCFGALSALIDADSSAPHVRVVALFDHEEVGSESATGARSALLGNVLKALGRSDVLVPSRSRFLSADMAHGLHPNYPDVHDVLAPITCGAGPVIKVHPNQRYATDASTAAEFRAICADNDIGCQTYSHRADLSCGSTIGPAVANSLGMATIDVGMAQLSMHSAREMMATSDISAMIQSFSTWLGTELS